MLRFYVKSLAQTQDHSEDLNSLISGGHTSVSGCAVGSPQEDDTQSPQREVMMSSYRDPESGGFVAKAVKETSASTVRSSETVVKQKSSEGEEGPPSAQLGGSSPPNKDATIAAKPHYNKRPGRAPFDLRLRIVTDVPGLCPACEPKSSHSKKKGGEEETGSSTHSSQPNSNLLGPGQAKTTISFEQIQTVESIEILFKELHQVFRGYTFPSPTCNGLKFFSSTDQELWSLHYALKAITEANEGEMRFSEPVTHFLQRGRPILLRSEEEKASKSVEANNANEISNYNSSSIALDEESVSLGHLEPHLILSANMTARSVDSRVGVSEGGGKSASSSSSVPPSTPNPHGDSSTVHHHHHVLQMARVNDYQKMHTLIHQLHTHIRGPSAASTIATTVSMISNLPAIFNTGSRALKDAKSKAQTLASSRESFIKFIEKRCPMWQKAAQLYSSLAVKVGELAVEHTRRSIGPPGDSNSTRTHIGRVKVSDDTLDIGDKVESVGGVPGTVMCLVEEENVGGSVNNRHRSATQRSASSGSASPPNGSFSAPIDNATSNNSASGKMGSRLVGVCWDQEGPGVCDGTLDGVKYFHCGPTQGSFLNVNNLYRPRDEEDDILWQMAEIIAAADDVLHPNQHVKSEVQSLCCQLSSLLQVLASFHQAHANSVTELLSVHRALVQGETWLSREESKKEKSRDLAREQQVKALIDSIGSEWWLASKAFGDGVENFRCSFSVLRAEVAELFKRVTEKLDVNIWHQLPSSSPNLRHRREREEPLFSSPTTGGEDQLIIPPPLGCPVERAGGGASQLEMLQHCMKDPASGEPQALIQLLVDHEGQYQSFETLLAEVMGSEEE